MASQTTVYDIKLQYTMGGDAGKGLDSLAAKADAANRSSEGLKSTLLGLAAALGAGKLFGMGKQAFVDFNNEMQQLQISLGAIIQMNLGGTFALAKTQAGELFKEFQNFAKVTPLTTKEIAEFSKNISAAVFTQGGNLQDFTELSERGALAAKVLGAEAGYAANEIAHMLSGNVESKMLFAINVLKPELAKRGLSTEQFKQMDPTQRLQLLKSAFATPGLTSATEDFATSFEGVFSTFKDNLQIALGKVGLPLFEKITKEIASWNGWIDKNDKLLRDMGTRVGEMLVKGFEAARDAAKFIVEHKNELMLLAGLWTANKIGGGLATSVGGLFGALSTESKSMATVFKFAAEPVGAFVSKLGVAIPALVAFDMALRAGAEIIDKRQKKSIENQADFASLAADLAKAPRSRKIWAMEASGAEQFQSLTDKQKFDTAVHALTLVKEMKAATDYGGIAAEVFRTGLLEKGAKTGAATIMTDAAVAAAEFLTQTKGIGFVRHLLGQTVGIGVEDSLSGGAGKKRVLPKENINLRIDKIEVASDDPDRFAIGIVHAFENMAKNPTSANPIPYGVL